MCRIAPTIGISRIFNHLLRIITLIIIGCPGMNDGLSSMQSKSNYLYNHDNMYLISNANMDSSSSGSSLSKMNNQIHSKDNVLLNNNLNLIVNNNNNNNNNNNLNNNKMKEDLVVTETENNLLEDIFNSPMYFGTENSTIITTQIGATAHLPCVIHHIGEGVVSWIRRKDYHLLTVGLTTYSSDERYSATHLKHSEDWTLQIKFVQLRDAGLHECQVSTHPPTSIFIHLNVVEARAEIVGPSLRYLTPGSTLKLMCRIIQNTETSAFIFWYHDNRMINYDVDRGINVSTEADIVISDYHYSELTIPKAKREHSGNYTCVPSNAQPASVLVHIFKGDNPAAMYHDHRGASDKSYQSNVLVIAMMLIIYCVNYRFKNNNIFELNCLKCIR